MFVEGSVRLLLTAFRFQLLPVFNSRTLLLRVWPRRTIIEGMQYSSSLFSPHISSRANLAKQQRMYEAIIWAQSGPHTVLPWPRFCYVDIEFGPPSRQGCSLLHF